MRLTPANPAFTLLLGVFAGLPALSIDLSAPTLTLLPSALDTSVLVAGLTLSLFMVGFAAGQFLGGRVSDRIGRRVVLLYALHVYVFGAVCCVFATTGEALVASRFAQGVGAGACAVQASAIVQDLFTGEAARRKQSYVTVVLGVVPMLAPAVGALMVQDFGWRSVHAVLAVCGVLLALVVAFAMRESRSGAIRPMDGYGFKAGLGMLGESWFMRIAVTNALSYGAIFSYIAGAPVVVMTRLGYSSAIYASLFAVTALSLTLGAYTNAGLGRREDAGRHLVLPALVLQAGANLALVLAGHGSPWLNLCVAVPALMACCFGRGLAAPNLIHLGVGGHRENAGLAAAMIGLSQLLVGALASAVVAALLPRLGFAAVAVPMAVFAGSAALFWWMTAGAAAPRPEPGL